MTTRWDAGCVCSMLIQPTPVADVCQGAVWLAGRWGAIAFLQCADRENASPPPQKSLRGRIFCPRRNVLWLISKAQTGTGERDEAHRDKIQGEARGRRPECRVDRKGVRGIDGQGAGRRSLPRAAPRRQQFCPF